MLHQHQKNLWYKHAVIYCLDVKTYLDTNGDGVGDFQGLTQQLDYIRGLGVNTLWLLPFYPSPNRDNGYDVTDYYNVHPQLGTLGDFVEFTHRAQDRGLRVIVDLVVNHTSNEHPWFQAARESEDSPYHDYYIWSEEKPPNADEGVVFPGVQEATWTYDEKAGKYYYHRFYSHQPDLNIAHPAVEEEIRKIMGFWLELGVNGFRIDAAPFIIELRGLDEADRETRENYLEFFRHFLSWRRGDAIMLAEANVAMDKLPLYLGDGDRMHMLFNFMVNQHLFAALAQEKAQPLIDGLHKVPDIPPLAQWAQFLRNHDELNLGRLDPEVREQVFEVFAPDPSMRLYDRGIRRRLAPILGNDRRRLELAFSLMFTLPGTPIIWYGQEIGMGEDLSLPERNSVRTPMQWANEENGGFSTADPDKLIRPVISEGEFGYERVNVADQRNDRASLLHWIQDALQVRQQCPEFAFGRMTVLDLGDPRVFGHCLETDEGMVIVVHNFSDDAITVTLNIGDDRRNVIDLHGNHAFKTGESGQYELELGSYGYRWFRIRNDQS